jgi:hypothetical protein
VAGWDRLGTTRLWLTKSRWWRWSLSTALAYLARSSAS